MFAKIVLSALAVIFLLFNLGCFKVSKQTDECMEEPKDVQK